jgi:hypothetical protein
VTTRIGLALTLIGIACFGGWACWAATRIWVPLVAPISLSRGHIRTAEFKINVEGRYEIAIEVRRGFDFWGLPCLIGSNQCEGNPGVIAVSWSLSSAGRVVAIGTSGGNDRVIREIAAMDRIVGGFDGGNGLYVLDLDVLQDGSGLNGGAPRLVVFEAGYEPRNNANDLGVITCLSSLLLAVVGTYLLIRPSLARRRERLAAQARGTPLTQLGPQPRDLRMDREPPALPVVQVALRPPASACVGAILVAAGLTAYASVQHWITTRNFVAVDIPVRLTAGHLRTGLFRIDWGEDYTISIITNHDDPHNASCIDSSALKTRWLLYRDGRVESGDDQTFGGYVGGFYAKSGVYALDVEVLKDAGCPNSAHPRLRVVTLTNSYAGFTSPLLWLCTIGMCTGGILLVIGGGQRLRKPPPPVAPSVHNGTVGGHFRWQRRPSKARPFSGISYFGLIATITFLLVSISIGFIQTGLRLVPKGLRIHLVRPEISAERTPSVQPAIQPVLVRLESGERSGRPNLYVDLRLVSWEDFGMVLQKQLNQRPPNWPVYLEGDPGMNWGWAVEVIDTIRGLQAEVVLLTSAPASPRGQSKSRTTPHPADTLHQRRR